MNQRKRILFVHPSAERPNGPDTCLYELVSRLDRTQFAFYLVIPAYTELMRKYEPLMEAIEIVPSVQVVNIPAPAAAPAFLAQNAAGAIQVRSILQKHRIDMVHNNVESCWLVGMVAKQMGIPSVMQIHGLTAINTPARQQIVPRAMRLSADRFVAVSRVVGETYIDAGIARPTMSVIDNGVDIAHFQPHDEPSALRQQFNIPPHVPLIGAIGAADARKGWIYLVMACALIRQQFPDMKCVFIGDDGRMGAGTELFNGVDRYIDAIDGLIHALQLQTCIIFAGPQSDMPQIYRSLDVLVQPSMIEAGPRAVIEGMASGTPLVATRVGGNADYITDQHDGLLVPLCDPAAMAAAVNRILGDRTLKQRLATNGRETAEKRFSLKTHVAHFHAIYAK